MPELDPITTDQLLTVGGVSVVTWIITGLIFKTAAFSEAQKARFGAVIATLLGIALAVVATAVLVGLTGDALLTAFITGLFGGTSAVGLHEVVSNTRGT